MDTSGRSIAEAILTLAKGVLVSYDKTAIMTVSKIEDVENGRYRVSANGSENIPAICIEGLKGKLSIGDRVLVKISNGSLSSTGDTTTNLIECKVKSSANDLNLLDELRNLYYESGTKTSDIYNHDTGEYALIAADSSNTLYKWNSSTQLYEAISLTTEERGWIPVPQSAAANRIFAAYASSYKYIRLSAKFKTSFITTHTKGVYGLKAIFEDTNGELKEYLLSFDSFVGTPYDYALFNTQEVVFDISNESLAKLVRFEFFESGFDPDRLPNTIQNIFMTDINVLFVDRPEIEPDSYYLYIETPNGTILDDSRVQSILLRGKLIYNTSVLLSADDDATLEQCRCYWYRENANISINSPNYDKLAGYGWEFISSGSAAITVRYSDVANMTKYRLIVIYNDTVTCMATVSVARYNDLYSLSIRPAAIGLNVYLLLFNGEETGTLNGNWYVLLPGGSYNSVATNTSQIEITSYKIYGYATFYCEAFDSSYNSLGTLSYFFDPATFMQEEEEEDVFVAFVGTDLYHYDANGQITIDESERQRSLQANIYMTGGGFLPSSSVSWYWVNGDVDVPITQTPTSLSSYNTMLDNVMVDSNNILYYNIKKTYRENFTKNTFKLVVIDIDGKSHVFYKDITFIKDGDLGTNGTGYSFKIAPFVVSGGAFLKYATGTTAIQSNLGIYLVPRVYKEDIELDYNSYTCTWNVSDNLNMTTSGFRSDKDIYVTVKGTFPTLSSLTSDSPTLEYWVKATITIPETGSQREILTSYYPVDLVTKVSSFDLEELDITTLLRYVKYTSAGFAPEYLNNVVDLYYQGNLLPLNSWSSSSSNKIRILTPNYLDVSSDFTRITPVRQFSYYNVNGSHTGLILLLLNSNNYLLHSVFMYLNTYGNEAINGWDGTQLEIDENGLYILAPMIGAGKKEIDPETGSNVFTGVLMGTNKGGGDDLANKTGLYGYQKGKAAFGLMEDGTSFLGRADSGGRIWMDGNVGTISGGDVVSSSGVITPAASGMYLRLANKNESGSTKAIGIGYDLNTGKEKFYVLYDGTMYANGAVVDGDVHARSFYLGDYLVLFTRDGQTNLKIDAANIMGSIAVSDTVYATTGDVVDLTVDLLKTSRRIPKYLRGDTSDDNYIHIFLEKMHYISGVSNGGTELATNPKGQLLYWEQDITGLSLNDSGYPIRADGTLVFIQTERTSWPVMVYSYDELVKGSFDFELNSETGYYEPLLKLGAGYGYDNPDCGRGIIKKSGESLSFMLINGDGDSLGISISDYFTDLYGLRKTTKLDFSNWGDGTADGSFTETILNNIEREYIVLFDSSGRPIKIIDANEDEMEIVWE